MEENTKDEANNNLERVNPNNSDSSPRKLKTLANKKIIIVVVVLVVLAIIALVFFLQTKYNSNENNFQANEYTYLADKAARKGDFESAQKSLRDALKEAPDDPKLLAALITSIANEGNLNGTEGVAFEKGKPIADKALKSYSKDIGVLVAVGFLYEVGGRYEEALSYYDQSLAIDPSNSNTMFRKAHVLEFLGREQESNKTYLDAYKLDKENPYLLMALGKMALSQGKTDDAVDFYKSAAASPTIPTYTKAEALANASIIRRNQFLYMEEAIDLARQAVDAYPNSSPALAALGFALGINGKIVEGVDYMKQSISANPRISQNYWYLGMLYRSVKEYDNALSYQKEGYAKVETDNTLLGDELRAKVKAAMAYDLAKTTYLSGSTENVLELLQTALKFDPTLKTQLKSDITEYNQFKSIANSPGVKELIK